MTSHAVRIWYAVLVSFLACLAVAFASVFYAGNVQREAAKERTQLQQQLAAQQRLSDQRWCRLFLILNPAGEPPTNERSRVIAAEILRLRHEFGCPAK